VDRVDAAAQRIQFLAAAEIARSISFSEANGRSTYTEPSMGLMVRWMRAVIPA